MRRSAIFTFDWTGHSPVVRDGKFVGAGVTAMQGSINEDTGDQTVTLVITKFGDEEDKNVSKRPSHLDVTYALRDAIYDEYEEPPIDISAVEKPLSVIIPAGSDFMTVDMGHSTVKIYVTVTENTDTSDIDAVVPE